MYAPSWIPIKNGICEIVINLGCLFINFYLIRWRNIICSMEEVQKTVSKAFTNNVVPLLYISK